MQVIMGKTYPEKSYKDASIGVFLNVSRSCSFRSRFYAVYLQPLTPIWGIPIAPRLRYPDPGLLEVGRF